MTSILVHYSEVALKGKNRSWFVGRLVRNIHGALAGLHVKEVRTHIGRIEIVLGQDSTLPEVSDRLSRIRPTYGQGEMGIHIARSVSRSTLPSSD